MSEIMKIINERESKKQKHEEAKERRKLKWKSKWFCCAFKLGFVQLICKSSLISKSNLESALSIIFKERELCESKHAAVECRYLKVWDLSSFNPSLKMTAGFANVARTTVCTGNIIY